MTLCCARPPESGLEPDPGPTERVGEEKAGEVWRLSILACLNCRCTRNASPCGKQCAKCGCCTKTTIISISVSPSIRLWTENGHRRPGWGWQARSAVPARSRCRPSPTRNPGNASTRVSSTLSDARVPMFRTWRIFWELHPWSWVRLGMPGSLSPKTW